jgi:hypothetical protein
MTDHDWYLENRLAFVTRTLEVDEELAFANHLSQCDDCQAAILELERELAWLPMGVPPVAPRPGLTRRLTEGVLRRRQHRWWPWAASLAIAASFIAALGVWRDAAQRIARLNGALEASQDSLSAIVGAERVFQESIKRGGYEGGVLIFYDQDTERWNVVVHDLPPARQGEAYQLWFVTGRGFLRGPELRGNGSRPTFLTLPAPDPASEVSGAVLTVGPPDGSSARPGGIELARLTF